MGCAVAVAGPVDTETEGDAMRREDSIDLAKKRRRDSLESLGTSSGDACTRGFTRLRTKGLQKLTMDLDSDTEPESSTPKVKTRISRMKSQLGKACRTASAEVDRLIDANPVILFSKTKCMKSRNAWSALAESAILFMVVEVEELLVGDVAGYREYLSEKTGIPGGLPCLFIQGQSTGSCDDILTLQANGKLAEMCSQAGAPEPEFKVCRSTSLKTAQRRVRRRNSRELKTIITAM